MQKQYRPTQVWRDGRAHSFCRNVAQPHRRRYARHDDTHIGRYPLCGNEYEQKGNAAKHFPAARPRGAAFERLGALMVSGYDTGGELRYGGQVSTGLSQRERAKLVQRLAEL